MKRISITSPEFEYSESDPERFRSGMFRIGPKLDAKQLGTTVYEIPPGQSLCPYHYEYAEEEWLIVLDGSATVRHPEGEDRLEPFDVACFPTGPAGAHEVRNDTGAPLRVLMYSTVIYPAATVYPDSDKIGVWTGNKEDDLMARRSSAVDYFEGEGREQEATE